MGPAVAFALFIASLLIIYEVWLPQILRLRDEAELRADPVRAAQRRQREKVLEIVGWVAGMLCGAIAFGLGFWAAGLL